MDSIDKKELEPVNDIYDDIRDGLKHTGSKELLKLLEDEVYDNNNIINSIVQLIINKVQNIEGDDKVFNSKIVKILNKLGKLSQRLTLLEDYINDLEQDDINKYCQNLKESYNYDSRDNLLSINEI